MTSNTTGGKDPDKLSVQLNEAFERLEKKADKAAMADAKPPKSPPSDQSRSRRTEPASAGSGARPARSGPFAGLALIISLVALGVASYAVWMAVAPGTALSPAVDAPEDPRVGALEARLQAAVTRMDDYTGQLDAVTARLDSLGTSEADLMASMQARVDEVTAEIRGNMGTTSQDWILAEVEYLLRMGSQRLFMERDTAGALALFKAADQVVRDSEGVVAYELRRSLAADIAALEAVAGVDVDGIFLRLSALASRVEQLRQKKVEFQREPVPEPSPVPVGEGYFPRFLALLQRGGDRLASLVDYRARDERINPILPPEEEYYLRQNLTLKLELAQLALLRGQQPLYNDSLAAAQSFIVENFDGDDPTTTTMLSALVELQMINIETPVPDVSGSLLEVRRLLARFHQSSKRGEQVE